MKLYCPVYNPSFTQTLQLLEWWAILFLFAKAVVERSVCSCVDSMVDWYDKADVCVARTTIVVVR